MQGKATLILTDKDTGRVVKQIEEHNMVTNAINSVFNFPSEMLFPSDSRSIFNGYLPMYENILKGLVLFGETIPENKDDFLLGGKYTVLSTAGGAYSGTDPMRGTLNENQSCEIENGYRFVWDFAPEKALGTIKALSLTHRLLGNRGNPDLSGDDVPYIMHPSDLSSGTGSGAAKLISGSGRFFLQKGKTTFYSYIPRSNSVTIQKYYLSDPNGLKICDRTNGILESEATINFSFSTSSGSYSDFFYNPVNGLLYAAGISVYKNNDVNYLMLKYAAVNPETYELISETQDWLHTSAPYLSGTKAAFYGDKIYVMTPNGSVTSLTHSGAVVNTMELSVYTFYGFQTVDGKLAVDCKFTSSGRRCLYFFDENKTKVIQHFYQYMPVFSETQNSVYYPSSYSGNLYLMLRTDYLATINNLSSPLEKTDQHALQVRYEITNE